MTVRRRLLLLFVLSFAGGAAIFATALAGDRLRDRALDLRSRMSALKADSFDLMRLIDDLEHGGLARARRQWDPVFGRLEDAVDVLQDAHPEELDLRSMRKVLDRAAVQIREVWELPPDVPETRRQRLLRSLRAGLGSLFATARALSDSLDHRVHTVDRWTNLALLIVLGLAIPGNAWLVFRTKRVLDRDMEAVLQGLDRYASGELGHETSIPRGSGEFARIAREMTRMAGSLAATTEQRDRAHEEIRRHRDRLRETVTERTRELEERVKEIRCIYQVSKAVVGAENVADACSFVAEILPRGWRFPESTTARVQLDGQEFVSSGFIETERSLSSGIVVAGRKRGRVEVFDTREGLREEDVSFLPEERDLLAAAARTLSEGISRYEFRLELETKNAALERSNQELQQFAYVASHDLQEPLRMVSSFTQLLGQRYGDRLDEDAREFIGYAVDGAERLQRLIRDLLAFSRVETRARPFEEVDLEEVFEEAKANLGATIEENGAKVTRGPLPKVLGDRGQLVKVLQNLVGNGIKFRGEEPPRVHVEAGEDAETWVVRVRDNGIGIDPQYAERIFTIFQRLHTREEYPGTGIGLAIVKRIVERHDGRVGFEPSPDGGTVFTFTIPAKNGGTNGRS